MRCAALALALALGFALVSTAAHAQDFAAPSLTADLAFAPPTGIARGDFVSGTITDIPAAVAVDGDRIYTVGRTQGGSGGADIGIIAQHSDGSLDAGFGDHGKLIVAIAAGTDSDIGTSLLVLPDHRLRVLASTDVTAGSSENLDVAILGLNQDGSPDLAFGAGTGQVVFPAGPYNDVPSRIVPGPDGRLAIVGSRSNGTRDDLFVSMREADGSPVAGFGTNGVQTIDRGGTVGGVAMVDRGVDVEFRNGGLLALVLVETNPSSAFDYVAALHAFDATGADDPTFSNDGDLVLDVGQPDTVPGGLLEYGGRYYVTGYTHAGGDTNAFLARVNADGSGFETRSFDMRGRVVAAGTAVVSRALDLALVPGVPPTIVAVGSIDWASDLGISATDWAAAAFNRFEGPLAGAGYGDLVLQAPGQGGLLSAAAGQNGWLAVTGTYIDNTTADNSYGIARLLVDAEKRCDLALSVADPAELVFRAKAPAALTATITNNGARACEGTLSAYAPYRANFATGLLAPKASVTATEIPVSYLGPRRAEGFMRVTVNTGDDADTSNNDALVHMVFRYCDLAVRPVGAPGLIPTEGARSFAVTLRNPGTMACAVRAGTSDAYSLEAGKSVSDRLRGTAPAHARTGTLAPVVLRALADEDVDPANNTATVNALVVGVGDSNIRRSGSRSISGRATAGVAKGLKASRLRVSRVDVALAHRSGKTCRWLRNDRMTFGAAAACDAPHWLHASGTSRWSLVLRKALTAGTYTVYSRAVIGAGFAEANFTSRDRNRLSLRIS